MVSCQKNGAVAVQIPLTPGAVEANEAGSDATVFQSAVPMQVFFPPFKDTGIVQTVTEAPNIVPITGTP